MFPFKKGFKKYKNSAARIISRVDSDPYLSKGGFEVGTAEFANNGVLRQLVIGLEELHDVIQHNVVTMSEGCMVR